MRTKTIQNLCGLNELDAERNVLLSGAYLSSNMAFENMTLAEATLKEAEDIFKVLKQSNIDSLIKKTISYYSIYYY